MKINTLLNTSVMLTVGLSSECARCGVSKISEFVHLVSLYTWLASSVLVLARTAIWDARGAVVVLHAALWFAKILFFAVVFGGHVK